MKAVTVKTLTRESLLTFLESSTLSLFGRVIFKTAISGWVAYDSRILVRLFRFAKFSIYSKHEGNRRKPPK